jgi:hypothetical protein
MFVLQNRTKGKSKLISIETEKISQQPENCENRNDPDLVQAFLRNSRLNQILKRQIEHGWDTCNMSLSLS